jgi:hypothetical protein
MFGSVFEFEWELPADGDGYTVVERSRTWPDKGPMEPVLVRRDGAAFRTYRPIRKAISLYRELAETKPTPAGVLAFANRYGWLGLAGDGTDVPVEPLRVWYTSTARLKRAVRVWDMVRVEGEAGLAKVIKWDGPSVVRYHDPEGQRRPASSHMSAEERRSYEGYDIIGQSREPDRVRAQIRYGDLIEPALLFVQNHVNGELAQGAAPQLVWSARRLGADPKDKRPGAVLQDVPLHLMGAVYVQFAQAVHAERESRRCAECGRWFELAEELTRSDRQTCSNSCRTRAYRRRQKRAVQLHAEGWTSRAIAKELDSTVKTVRKWVTTK